MADVEHLRWREMLNAPADGSWDAILDAYFEPFAMPPMTMTESGRPSVGKHPCLKCGCPLHAELTDQLFGYGGFEWGLVHGEGRCVKCRWPARKYHFIKGPGGEEQRIDFILQYHPDCVTQREPAESA